MNKIHRITLPSGHAAIVDADDAELVASYRWHALLCGRRTYAHGYRIGDSSHRRLLHRVLLDPPTGLEVDHINHDGLDNRRANLRLATGKQNHGNERRPVNNISGYKGVSWHREGRKWQACIHIDRRTRYLGLFEDPWEAAQAYNAAALEEWGEFAFLNVRMGVGAP